MWDVEKALRSGASHYLIKQIVSREVLEHSVANDYEKAQLRTRNRSDREELERTVKILREDQKAGRSVQLKLFPDSPKQYGPIEFSHYVAPSLFLSGDFVDYYRINDRYVGFYLADVSGHGASSAFGTLLLKNLVDRLVRRYNNAQAKVLMSPARTLKRINEEFISLDLDKHLAIFCGIIDLQNLTVLTSGGSHLPAPILVNRGEAVTIPGKGLPVGIFPDAEYQQYAYELAEDFQLQVFSDGVLELMEQDTIEEKEAFLLANATKKTHTIKTLMQTLKLDEQKDLPDDVALLVISGMK